MMKKIYFVLDENGEFYSTDRECRYRKVAGEQINTEIRKWKSEKRRFYINNGVAIEVPFGKEKEIRKNERRKQYVKNCESKSGYETIYLYAQSVEEGVNSDEILSSENEDVWLKVLHNLVVEDLYKGIDTLSEDEKYIIMAMYLNYPNKKQGELAEELGITQQAVSKKIKSAKKKLKKFLENWL